MELAHPDPEATDRRGDTQRIGCVSYLNAKPLIDGLDRGGTARHRLRLDVPSRLLRGLEEGRVEIALCPVIDYFRSAVPLAIVPAGGIGSDGETLTVRLYSRVPIEAIRRVHADTDSHTSVALLRVLLAEAYGLRPTLEPFAAAEARDAEGPEAMLLIGDKVVTRSPLAVAYPHQLDLGEAWKRLTGLPFVFATWLARRDADLGTLPAELAALRERNAGRIDAIVETYAEAHGWPRALARRYLGGILRYRVGERELEAIRRFAALAQRHGLIDEAGPLVVEPIAG